MTISDTLVHLVVNVFTLLLYFSLGCGVLFGLKVPISRAFVPAVSVFIGMLLVICSYALIITGGRTVLLGLIPLIGFFYYAWKRKYTVVSPTSSPQSPKPFLTGAMLLAVCVLFWTLVYTLLFLRYGISADGLAYYAPHQDVFVYQKLGMLISATGKENFLFSINYLEPELSGLTQYHYLDIYFFQILIDVFDLPPTKAIILSAYPLVLAMASVFLVNAAQYWSTQTKTSYWLLLPFGLFALLSGIKLPVPVFEAGLYALGLFGSAELKFVLPYLFMVASVILYIEKEHLLAILPLLALPIVSYTLLPSVMFGLFLYLGYRFYRAKTGEDRKELAPYFILYAGVGVFLLFFYRLFPVPPELSRMGKLSLSGLITYIMSDPAPFVRIVLGTLVKIWLDYILFVLILVLLALKHQQLYAKVKATAPAILLYGGMIVGGLLCWALLKSFTLEAIQPFWVAQGLVFNALIAVLAIYLIMHKRAGLFRQWAFMGLFLIACWILVKPFFVRPWLYKYDPAKAVSISFLEKVNRIVEEESNDHPLTVVASFCSGRVLFPEGNYPGSELLINNNRLLITSISADLIKKAEDNKHDFFLSGNIIGTPFYQHVQRTRSKGNSDTSMTALQQQFLQLHKIDFLLQGPECSGAPEILNDFTLVAADSINDIMLYKRVNLQGMN